MLKKESVFNEAHIYEVAKELDLANGSITLTYHFHEKKISRKEVAVLKSFKN